jgi:hypothetical protein
LAQPYPSRTVTIVVPFPPGGGTDTGTRIVAQKLSQKWGHPWSVENKAGAAGMLGGEHASKAKPDGYTLLMGNVGTQSINSTLYGKRMTYNPDTAFHADLRSWPSSARDARGPGDGREERAGGDRDRPSRSREGELLELRPGWSPAPRGRALRKRLRH